MAEASESKSISNQLKDLKNRATEAFGELAGRIGFGVRGQKSFVAVHEAASDFLRDAAEVKTFGDFELTTDRAAEAIHLISRLNVFAESAEERLKDSDIDLIPDELVVAFGRDAQERNKILNEVAKAEKTTKGEVTPEEAWRLAGEAYQAENSPGEKWRNKGDKQQWEEIKPEDRSRLTGIRHVFSSLNLELTKDGIKTRAYRLVEADTGKELELKAGDKVVKFEPEYESGQYIDPDSGTVYGFKQSDSKPYLYQGELKKHWLDGVYAAINKGTKDEKILRFKRPIKETMTAVTAKGERIKVKHETVLSDILPSLEDETIAQEIGLRELLVRLTVQKAAGVADTYMTALINKGGRIGFSEEGAARGIVIEGVSPGGAKHENVMTALQRGGVYEKWRAIATCNEQNDRFVMFFEARNRDAAQKAADGARLSRLASTDNIVAWIEQVPDMSAVLSWQEWQGLRNPKTGEPVDYPAIILGDDISVILQDRLSQNLVQSVIKVDGTEVSGSALANYQGINGDIFVLKPAKNEHKSMALIKVMKERARYLGIDGYVVDLGFAFHRFMFTGADKGISYNKAMTVGDYWNMADMVGMGQQIREDYNQLTPEQKKEFETTLSRLSIFQTGVKGFFQQVLGLQDGNAMNQDRYFREVWGDRAPLYQQPADWIQKRIDWSDEKVNWPVELARREMYRWMANFTYTIGKGLKDVSGEFAGKEVPFNWENPHHVRVLVDYLMSSSFVQRRFTEVGLNSQQLGRTGVENLLKQIFHDKTLPADGETNFLNELKKFNERAGYQQGLKARAADFNQVEARYGNAVKLEKVLENPEIFGNLLKFVDADGWSPNQQLVEHLKGFGGIINEGSYDRLIHNQIYWYANYLTIYDNFMRLRLGKEMISVDQVKGTILDQWQDQSRADVRGTPQAFLLHFINELNEEFIIDRIKSKELNHIQLNDLSEEHRLWRDAVLFYQEPELAPAEHEKKVQEYCRQRMLKLHLILDETYVELLRKNLIQLQQVKGLVDPDGQIQMFKWAVRTKEGKIVGPREDNGRDSDEYLQAYTEAVAGFYREASELDEASLYYQLDMTSTWTPEVEVQTVSKDGQGLNKYDILKVWFGVLENDVPLYNQVLAWYKQLRDLPPEAWETQENGKYSQIPQILVGFAREYLSDFLREPDGTAIDLRDDKPEAETCRVFFRKWLYMSDLGGYQRGATRVYNDKLNDWEDVGAPQFNKAFQILTALILTRNVGGSGIPKDREKGAQLGVQLDAARYFLYLNQLRGLVNEADNPGNVEQRLGFYDLLMGETRVGRQTWAQFFAENNVEWLADKMTIVEKMADLISRDRMFSPLYNQYGEYIQQWMDLDQRPDAPDFDMAAAVDRRLRNLISQNGLDEIREINNFFIGEFGPTVFAPNSPVDIREIHRKMAEEFGLRILPRGYWMTRFFRKVRPNEVGQILRDKLPPEKQARRWAFMNYGVDIGAQPTMDDVYQSIRGKIPHKWRNFDNPKEETYFKILGEGKDFKMSSALRFAFGNSWLDETFFNKPHYDRARRYLSSLHERILLVPTDSYLGVLRRAKFTAQNSMYYYQIKLIAGQLAMTDAEKVKIYEELRGMIPPMKFSWELLEKAADKLFGFGERQIDFNTDFWLTMEHVPMPVISAFSTALSGWGPLKGLQGLDSFIKKYIDAPWGAVPAMIGTVGIPVAAFAVGAFATLPWWGVAGIFLGGYELANIAARIYMPLITKSMDKAKAIEWYPQVPFLIKKGIIK